jgi:ankyrin repeat protein
MYSTFRVYCVHAEQEGQTVLLRASRGDHADIAKLLLEAGAAVNIEDNVRAVTSACALLHSYTRADPSASMVPSVP